MLWSLLTAYCHGKQCIPARSMYLKFCCWRHTSESVVSERFWCARIDFVFLSAMYWPTRRTNSYLHFPGNCPLLLRVGIIIPFSHHSHTAVYIVLETCYVDFIIPKFSSLLRSRKLRLTVVGDPARWPRDTPLSTKVGTTFRRQVAVAQSILVACGLKATEFVLVFSLLLSCVNLLLSMPLPFMISIF
jgi:hypothetical protein